MISAGAAHFHQVLLVPSMARKKNFKKDLTF